MDEKHDYVTVDKDRVTRCLWCGTVESKDWIKTGRTDISGFYCSKRCELADVVNYRRRGVIACPICGIFSIAFGIAISSFAIDWAMFFVVMGGIMLISSLFCIEDYQIGLHYRKIVPRGSRRDNRSLEILVLKQAQTIASCPRCGGNIDLNQIGSNRIFTCPYCGVEGILEYSRENR